MWVTVTLVTIPKLTPDGVEYIVRAFVSNWPPGRIPGRDTIVADAYEKAREFFQFIADTVGGTRAYEYGDPVGASIVSVTFVRR